MARVLIVDDQPTILLMLERLLLGQGHAVTSVTNPMDAIEKLNAFPFDLLITDIVMPGGVSGIDLAKTVKANEKLANLPIVLLSGRREKRDIEKGVKVGVDDYIVKPIDPDLFLAKINSLLKAKSPNSINFLECSVKQPFQWEVVNEIVRISEVGLVLNSTLAIEVGSKVKINSPFLEDMDLHNTQLRVVSCEKVNIEPAYYLIKTHFIGLTESALQPLRVWIRSNQMKSA